MDAGRSLSLLDPTYASKYIPIIASVSEHQPPSWPSYFTDLQARACSPLRPMHRTPCLAMWLPLILTQAPRMQLPGLLPFI